MDQAAQLRNLVKSQKSRNKCAEVITVTSGKGGVGKSNVSVNLAIQMRKLGKKVIIFDADFGLANVEVMFGIRPDYNLSDLIFKNKDLADIICEGPQGIQIISGGSGVQEMANLTKYQITNLTSKLWELDQLADIIIIDTGAGISDAVLDFAVNSNEVLVVVTPEPTSITDAYALLKALNKRDDYNKDNPVKILANKVDSEKEGRLLFGNMNVVVKKFLDVKADYLGSIPQDVSVSKAVIRQVPFSIAYPNSKAALAVSNLADVLLKNTIFVHEDKRGISYLFSKFIHKGK